jgi:hypothetical protein
MHSPAQTIEPKVLEELARSADDLAGLQIATSRCASVESRKSTVESPPRISALCCKRASTVRRWSVASTYRRRVEGGGL